jgi:hypothetical protein
MECKLTEQMVLTPEQKELTSKIRENVQIVTKNNAGFEKKQIITIAINRLYEDLKLKNKSKTAFQKEMKDLIKKQKINF